jgi:hypothetical protein
MSLYIWSEKLSPKSEEGRFVLTSQTKTIERDWNCMTSNSNFNFRHLSHLGKECAKILYFAIDLIKD